MQNTEEYYRYCPGQEEVKISNAICFGRQRGNYPKCKDCQFRGDEKQEEGANALISADRQAIQAEKIQRENIEHLFQSETMRGIYPDTLDAEISWRLGQGIAQFLRSELRGYDRARAEMSAIVVGRDMRKSSQELADALIEGLRTGGSPAIDVGMIDTGLLYFAVNHLTCCGGVQVTGSRYPAQYNGFVVCGRNSKPISRETGLGKICKIALNTRRHSIAQTAGMEQVDLSGPYKKFVRGFLKPSGGGFNSERPLKLVIDASNGMGGRWVPLLFSDVDWLEIIRLNFEHNGEFLHDPDPLVEANLGQVKDRVLMAKADLGVCLDGDADGCVFVDDRGQTVRSDLLTALLAKYILRDEPGSSVVYDLRSSRVVYETIREAGGIARRERCSNILMKKAMADSKSVFGGGPKGYYYYRDNACCESGMLTLTSVLNVLTETGKPLSELMEPLKRYAHSGERGFENDDAGTTINKLSQKYKDAQL
ncbi:MAG: hypothetical protein JSV03_03800, partial [Planctomycetota bacterium]